MKIAAAKNIIPKTKINPYKKIEIYDLMLLKTEYNSLKAMGLKTGINLDKLLSLSVMNKNGIMDYFNGSLPEDHSQGKDMLLRFKTLGDTFRSLRELFFKEKYDKKIKESVSVMDTFIHLEKTGMLSSINVIDRELSSNPDVTLKEIIYKNFSNRISEEQFNELWETMDYCSLLLNQYYQKLTYIIPWNNERSLSAFVLDSEYGGRIESLKQALKEFSDAKKLGEWLKSLGVLDPIRIFNRENFNDYDTIELNTIYLSSFEKNFSIYQKSSNILKFASTKQKKSELDKFLALNKKTLICGVMSEKLADKLYEAVVTDDILKKLKIETTAEISKIKDKNLLAKYNQLVKLIGGKACSFGISKLFEICQITNPPKDNIEYIKTVKHAIDDIIEAVNFLKKLKAISAVDSDSVVIAKSNVISKYVDTDGYKANELIKRVLDAKSKLFSDYAFICALPEIKADSLNDFLVNIEKVFLTSDKRERLSENLREIEHICETINLTDFKYNKLGLFKAFFDLNREFDNLKSYIFHLRGNLPDDEDLIVRAKFENLPMEQIVKFDMLYRKVQIDYSEAVMVLNKLNALGIFEVKQLLDADYEDLCFKNALTEAEGKKVFLKLERYGIYRDNIAALSTIARYYNLPLACLDFDVKYSEEIFDAIDKADVEGTNIEYVGQLIQLPLKTLSKKFANSEAYDSMAATITDYYGMKFGSKDLVKRYEKIADAKLNFNDEKISEKLNQLDIKTVGDLLVKRKYLKLYGYNIVSFSKKQKLTVLSLIDFLNKIKVVEGDIDALELNSVIEDDLEPVMEDLNIKKCSQLLALCAVLLDNILTKKNEKESLEKALKDYKDKLYNILPMEVKNSRRISSLETDDKLATIKFLSGMLCNRKYYELFAYNDFYGVRKEEIPYFTTKELVKIDSLKQLA